MGLYNTYESDSTKHRNHLISEEIKRLRDLQISPLAQLSRVLVEFISEIMATQIEDSEGGERDHKQTSQG